jgi:hypothetical protein
MFICTRVAEVSETLWKNLSEESSPRPLPHPYSPMPAWVRELDEEAAKAVGEVAVVEALAREAEAARELEADPVLAEEVKDNEDLHSHHGRGRHG